MLRVFYNHLHQYRPARSVKWTCNCLSTFPNLGGVCIFKQSCKNRNVVERTQLSQYYFVGHSSVLIKTIRPEDYFKRIKYNCMGLPNTINNQNDYISSNHEYFLSPVVFFKLSVVFFMVVLKLSKNEWLSYQDLIAIASASQAQGDGFDSRERHPKFALGGTSFVPKTCH